MEQTNYVAKAKRLLMTTARTTALVIVPLAAAVNAHAGSIALPTGNVTCSTELNSGSGPGCFGEDAQIGSDPGSGVWGVTFSTSGGTYFSVSSGAELSLELGASGQISGGSIAAGTVIPVAWVADLDAFSGASIEDWTISFSLGTSPGDASLGFISGSGTSGGLISGSSSLTVDSTIASGSTLFETAELVVFTSSSSGEVEINVPGSSSFDFDDAAAVGTPEPASVGLMGAGLALLGAMFRRRRNQ